MQNKIWVNKDFEAEKLPESHDVCLQQAPNGDYSLTDNFAYCFSNTSYCIRNQVFQSSFLINVQSVQNKGSEWQTKPSYSLYPNQTVLVIHMTHICTFHLKLSVHTSISWADASSTPSSLDSLTDPSYITLQRETEGSAIRSTSKLQLSMNHQPHMLLQTFGCPQDIEKNICLCNVHISQKPS